MMISVYFLIFFSLALGLIFALVFVWAVKSKQFDDIEAPKYEMLEPDDEYDEDDRAENRRADNDKEVRSDDSTTT